MRLAALALGLALAAPALAGEARLTAEMPGGPTLTLEARGAGEHWTIRVLDGRTELQRIAVETDAPDGTPFLADANGDGAPDLLVPSAIGNGNAAYDLWLYDRAKRRFAQAGEIAGIAFGRDGPWYVALGRDGCCGAVYSFQTLSAAGALEEAFAIEVGLGEGGRVSRCAAAPDTTVPAEVLRRYCAMRLGTLPGRFGPPR